MIKALPVGGAFFLEPVKIRLLKNEIAGGVVVLI